LPSLLPTWLVKSFWSSSSRHRRFRVLTNKSSSNEKFSTTVF
jgi:hypothetical protein